MTTNISASMIKELRERTGIGMGKCKEALVEAKGDIELAVSNLRKSGLASAIKKEGRTTNEGVILAKEHGNTIAFVEINAETDFVVRNDLFRQFVENIAEEIVSTTPPSLEAFLIQHYSKDPVLTIDQYRATMVQAIGENIQIRRFQVLTKGKGRSIGLYSHLGGKILTVVEIEGAEEEEGLARDIAMHVAAAHPEYLSPQQVPSSIVDNEREIAQTQMQGKPAMMIDRILEGKINAYYDSVCLIRQKYIRDDSISIGDLVEKRSKEINKPLKLVNFFRWSVGA
jgi:elongation factor Ts